jgi:hypothetical protein
MSNPGQLSLARYAEALVYTREYTPALHPVVLERLGIGAEDLDRAGQAWSSELAAALVQGDSTLALLFAQAYTRVEQQVRLLHPPPTSVRPLEDLEVRAEIPAVRAPAIKPLPRRVRPEDEPRPAASATPLPPAGRAPGDIHGRTLRARRRPGCGRRRRRDREP